MTDAVGFNINTMFDRVAETIAKKGEELNTTLNGMGDEISVSKALTDEAKQIAQRAN